MESLAAAQLILNSHHIKTSISEDIDTGFNQLIALTDSGTWAVVCCDYKSGIANHFSDMDEVELLKAWALENKINGPSPALSAVSEKLAIKEIMEERGCSKEEAEIIAEFA